MSELDIRALEANFDGWRQERAPDLGKDRAFERYAIELIFRDLDPSDDEIDAGWLGGGDDGGLDGVYFVVNRRFMPDEFQMPNDVFAVELHLIQAKYETGFGEMPVQKFEDFIEDLFTYGKSVDQLNYYNRKLRDRISAIREMYEAVIGRPHTFTVTFWYATKSDQIPNPKVQSRINNLKGKMVSLVTSAKPQFETWGARDLTNAFRTPRSTSVILNVNRHFMCDDGSVVCLATLSNFADFLTDDNETLREYLLEPNVRDYAGKWNPVNKDIRASLESSDVAEFWWFNNGITILADACQLGAGKATMESPELVNGLQTSHEIFNFFSLNKKQDDRSVLVRIILPPDDQTRRRVTKATNFQTPVNVLSLRATEDIHFDIEELLKLYGLFYDRRKGEYRRLRKPINKIISIRRLAQTVIAIALRRPADARARPMSVLATDEGYKSVFDVDAKRDLFLFCVLLDRHVETYLVAREDIPRDTRNDIQFYVGTLMASYLTEEAKPSKDALTSKVDSVKQQIPQKILNTCTEHVLSIYKRSGGDATAAKGTSMTAAVLKLSQEIFQES